MKERLPYIDLLKIIACFAVINLHCTSPWVTHFIGSPIWFVAMGNAVLTHLAVPLFFMLAGAIIPERVEDLGRHYRNTLWRYVVPTLLSLVLYKILGIILLGQRDFLAGLFYSIGLNPGFHLWFMWIYIGYMLVFPPLVAIARNDNARKVFLYAGILFVFIVPTLSTLFNITFPIANVLTTVYSFYFIAGHHLAVTPKRFETRKLLRIFGIMYLVTFAAATISAHDDTQYFAKFLTANSIFVFVLTSLVFLLAKQTFNYRSKIITALSKHTFNIYLLHIAFFLKPFSFIAFPSITIHGLLGSIFWTTPVTFMFCLCISIILNSIKRIIIEKRGSLHS